MADQSPSGFEVAGEVYEVPRLDTFDMDEAQILYDLSGIVIEDFIPAHPDLSDEMKAKHEAIQIGRVRSPALKRALVHVAYRRKHGQYDFAELDASIGKMNALDVAEAVFSRGGDEVDPSMTSPKQPDTENSTSETSEASSSGSPSRSDSDERVVTLRPTGTGESGTSSQVSAEASSGS